VGIKALSPLVGVLVFAQISFLCAAAFFLFDKKGNTFAESAAYAIITVFMLLSFIRQIGFITGLPPIATGLETLFFVASLIQIFRQRHLIPGIFKALKSVESVNPVAFIFLGICLVYMALHAVLPISEGFQHQLDTLFLYEKEGFFPLGAAPDFPAFLPVNHLILFSTFVGFDPDAGIGIFCFLAYLSIGFSTYALARRYSWQGTAFTTSILVMSMPRLVVQAIHPGTQIISAAVVLFCILALYRCCEQPNLMDLVLLILGIFFCVSENISTLIFAPILLVLSCVVLFRRHGIAEWKNILVKAPHALLAIFPAIVFSQSWLFLSNTLNKASRPGPFSDIPFNPDGIQGALANFIRYILEGFIAAVSMDFFSETLFQWPVAQNLETFYDYAVIPFLGDSGAAQVFHLAWNPGAMFSFGPFGFFLVLPALVYAVLKGPRRLKSLAIAFFVYFYLASLILAWAPGNARFFEIFYVCSGFSIAFFLPPWRLTKTKRRGFQAAGCILLFLTLLAAS
jgi:hypothetical protein